MCVQVLLLPVYHCVCAGAVLTCYSVCVCVCVQVLFYLLYYDYAGAVSTGYIVSMHVLYLLHCVCVCVCAGAGCKAERA